MAIHPKMQTQENDQPKLNEEVLEGNQVNYATFAEVSTPEVSHETYLIFKNCLITIDRTGNVHEKAVNQELNWLLHIIYYRCTHPNDKINLEDLEGTLQGFQSSLIQAPMPNALEPTAHYHQWLNEQNLTHQLPERLFMALGFAAQLAAPMLYPLNLLWEHAAVATWTGGSYDQHARSFTPTMRSLFYLLAGPSQSRHNHLLLHFETSCPLLHSPVINLISKQADTPMANKQIKLQAGYALYFLGGEMPRPEHNRDLPIRRRETSFTFDDLILPATVKERLSDITDYARKAQDFFANPATKAMFNQGNVALLYGPPGTGKTMIATTIGKALGLATYQLNVAQTVSKYIGETSKNINKVFEEIERSIEHLKGEPSILFIDEADALIGKRSEVKDSKDRYANLDVANLLEKLEQFPGLVIMASNLEKNFDPAINRRVEHMIMVPPPEAQERALLWEKYRPSFLKYPTNNFSRVLANKFKFTGAQIKSILKKVSIKTHGEGISVIDYDLHLERFIRDEHLKNDEVYVRPRDLMTIAQIEKNVYDQQLLWEEAQPAKWVYNPTYLPRILSQAVSLSKEDIEVLVKKTKRKWEGGAYNMLPFEQGIEVVLRELCVERGLPWGNIQLKIQELLAKEAPRKEGKPRKDKSSSQSKTARLVPPEKLKEVEAQIDKKTQTTEPPVDLKPTPPPVALQPGKAELQWRVLLPEGFILERGKATSRLLANRYALTINQIKEALTAATALAQKDNTQVLDEEQHLKVAIQALCKKYKKEHLYTDYHLKKLQKKQKGKQAKEAPSTSPTPAKGVDDQTLTTSQAERVWRASVPENYALETKGRPSKTLGDKYAFTQTQIKTIVAIAADFAQRRKTQVLKLELHLLPAIQQYVMQEGKAEEDFFSAKHIEKLAAERKQVLTQKRRQYHKRIPANKAAIYWTQVLPQGYFYAKNVPSVIGNYYGPYSYGEVDKIIAQVCHIAQAEAIQEISLEILEQAMLREHLLKKTF